MPILKYESKKKTGKNIIIDSEQAKMDLFEKLRTMKTLLIDDDKWIRDSLSLFFQGEGCQLTTLETAEEGLKLLKNKDYQIIFADYYLPGINGLEFFHRIRDSHSCAIKILITAHGNNQLEADASKLGIHDFIEKPFTTGSIEESLNRLLINHKQGIESSIFKHTDPAKRH